MNLKFIPLLPLLTASATSIPTSSLPIVDLGYVRQRETEHNTTGGLYIYRNVRYSRPPLGEFRFRKPQPPLQEPNDCISDGSQFATTVCSQQVPLPGMLGTGTPNTSAEDCWVTVVLTATI
jgi:carboxylesterase type B